MNDRAKESKDRKTLLSATESVILGLITGILESIINLPLWTYKIRAQCDLPRTFDPTILYRGFLPSAFTMATFMSLQMLNSSLAEKSLSEDKIHTTPAKRAASAFVGGAIPSVLFCPLDLVITQYHKHNYPSYSIALKSTLNKIGIRGLFAGLPATALTDGNYALWYWGLFPRLKEHLHKKHYSTTTSILIAGLTSGLGATALGQAVDMIKTLQQKLIDEVPPDKRAANSMVRRFSELRNATHGVGLWKAVVPRFFWLTSSITSAGLIAEKIEAYTLANRRR